MGMPNNEINSADPEQLINKTTLPPLIQSADLGIVTVPDDYDPASYLALFKARYQDQLSEYDDRITDNNFPSVLKPRDNFKVLIFRKSESSENNRITSSAIFKYLRSVRAVLASIQGACLVWEQKKEELARDRGYIAVGEIKNLWLDQHRFHRLPYLMSHQSGRLTIDLGFFENGGWIGYSFFCFLPVTAKLK